MPKSSGGGGNGGRSGGGDQPIGTPEEQLMNNLRSGKLSLEDSIAAERATYRASKDAFFKEKNYDKAGELEKKYKVMEYVNQKYQVEQAAKKVDLTKGRWSAGGPSVRDDDSAGGRRDLNSDFVKRMRSPKFR